MTRARHYAGLLGLRLRLSLSLAAAYRADFVIDAVLALVWVAVSLAPLYVAFHERPNIGGWTFESALVVTGCFVVLRAVLDGAVSPSLAAIVDQIRTGTLDFVLLKPADAQFLVSTSRFEVFRLLNVLLGIGIFVWAFSLLGRAPALGDVLLALLLFGAAIMVLYSLWILVIAAAFWVVRLDNLAYLLSSIFDFARWPISMMKGVLAFVLTFIIPLALMTTYPAEALLGVLSAQTAVASLVGAFLFSYVARRFWVAAIGRYTSASS